MQVGNIQYAEKVARRFLDDITVLKRTGTFTGIDKYANVVDYPKEQGALRRSSMDLTRALAQMRRP